MNRKNLIVVTVVMALVLICLFGLVGPQPSQAPQMPFTAFMERVHEKKINDVVVSGRRIIGHLEGGVTFATYLPDGASIIDDLIAGVRDQRNGKLP